MSQKEKEFLCDNLFFSLNWFREVINAFATQTDPEMKAKVITRLHNVTELQAVLEKCLHGRSFCMCKMFIYFILKYYFEGIILIDK